MTTNRECREWLAETKRSQGCWRCGAVPSDLNDLHFVHRRGQRRFSIGSGNGYPAHHPTLVAEIAKCDLLCPACRERTELAAETLADIEATSWSRAAALLFADDSTEANTCGPVANDEAES